MVFQKGNIPWNKGKKLPQFSGKNHPRWKGGEVSLSCIVCNKKFKVRLHRKNKAKYCSQKCYGKDIRKDKIKTCKTCNKHFYKAPSQRAQYCSWSCFQNKIGEQTEKTCQVCKKKFKVISSKKFQKFCSLKCAYSGKSHVNRGSISDD